MLRPYQVQAVKDVIQSYREGVTRQLGVFSTGLGKTVVVAHLPRAMRTDKRVLFLCHRDELVYQAHEKFSKYNPGRTVAIEKADHRSNGSDIVIASVQSIGRRLEDFNPDDFSIVIVDEVHHAVSEQYKKILRHMRVLNGEPNDPHRLLLGITATPSRGDRIGLECLFDKIVFNYDLREAINDGWLSKIVAYRSQTEIDISKVRTQSGDFSIPDLERTVNVPIRNEYIADTYLKVCKGSPALFFTVDIAHAHDLSEVLRSHGIRCYPVSGKTPDQERKRLMSAYRAGDIDGLASAGVLSEGLDLPMAIGAFMCRPTKSQLLYRQQIGRVLRPYPAPEESEGWTSWRKNYCVVVDFVDIAGHHSLIVTPTLFGLRGSFNSKGKNILQSAEEIERLEAEHPELDLHSAPDLDAARRAVRHSVERIDLLAPPVVSPEVRKYSQFTWLTLGEGRYQLALPNRTLLQITQNQLDQWEVYSSSQGQRTLKWVAPNLPHALTQADAMVPPDAVQVLHADAGWRSQPPSRKQCNLLWKLCPPLRDGYKDENDMFRKFRKLYRAGSLDHSKGAVSRLIDSRLSKKVQPIRRMA